MRKRRFSSLKGMVGENKVSIWGRCGKKKLDFVNGFIFTMISEIIGLA